MNIYIDTEYRCHLHHSEGFRMVETDVFNGMCENYIEGFRYIPENEMWQREDGAVFYGVMSAPIKEYSLLACYQQQYEEDEAIHLAELAELIDEIYAEDLEVIES